MDVYLSNSRTSTRQVIEKIYFVSTKSFSSKQLRELCKKKTAETLVMLQKREGYASLID